MTPTTDLSRMTKDEILAFAADCARLQRQAEALIRRLQLQLALSNYERRQRGQRVLHGWARLADTAVSARLWCRHGSRTRGPF
jgi:hypothetical protein